MSNEANVRMDVSIIKGNLQFTMRGRSYLADVSTAKAPVPGRVNALTTYTVADLTPLTVKGLCWVGNLSSTYTVQMGVFIAGAFLPLLDFLPGEFTMVRLSQYLGREEDVTAGTGTANTTVTQLAFKALGGAAEVEVYAFER